MQMPASGNCSKRHFGGDGFASGYAEGMLHALMLLLLASTSIA
jgi:hypothetical protein